MNMKTKETTIVVAAAALLAGCETSCLPSVGANYVEPEVAAFAARLPDAGAPTTNLNALCEYTPADKASDDRLDITSDSASLWWRRFNDPILAGIVEAAVSSNMNYLAASSRLAQANWELLGTYSAFMPKASVDGSAMRSEAHRNNRSMASSGRRHSMGDVFKGGMNATWELDVFGGSRRATEAALAVAEAAGWSVADAWVALTTSIGSEYVSLRTVQERIAVARTNLVLQSETYGPQNALTQVLAGSDEALPLPLFRWLSLYSL